MSDFEGMFMERTPMALNDASNLTMETRLVRSKDQVSAELQGEAVILSLKSGKYYNLNLVGSRIWELIEKVVSIRTLHEIILNEYEVEDQRCRDDIFRILNQLLQADLIEIVSPEMADRQ